MRSLALLRAGFETQLSYRAGTVLLLFEYLVAIALFTFLYTTILPDGFRGFSTLEILRYAIAAWFVKSIIPASKAMRMIEDVAMGRNYVQFATIPLSIGDYAFLFSLGRALPRALLLFLLALLAGLNPLFFAVALLGAAINILYILTASWLVLFTKKMSIVKAVFQHLLVGVLGGVYIPFMLLPDPIRAVAEVLPLRFIGHVPAMAALGKADIWDIVEMTLWIPLLYILYRVVERYAVRWLEVQGV